MKAIKNHQTRAALLEVKKNLPRGLIYKQLIDEGE
jgi:hypothetical protein